MSEHYSMSESEFERIEAYLRNELPENERKSFEEDMAGDQALRDKVEDVRMAIETVSLEAFKKKLDQARSFHLAQQASHKRPRRMLVLWVGVAAAVIFAFFRAWQYIAPEGPGEALFSAYYKPDPGLPTPMSEAFDSVRYHFYDAMVDYKSEDYPKAIEKWENLNDTRYQNDSLNYFLASAYLAEENHEASKALFQEVARTDTSVFQQKARWYLFLMSMKVNDRAAMDSFFQVTEGAKKQKMGEVIRLMEQKN